MLNLLTTAAAHVLAVLDSACPRLQRLQMVCPDAPHAIEGYPSWSLQAAAHTCPGYAKVQLLHTARTGRNLAFPPQANTGTPDQPHPPTTVPPNVPGAATGIHL